MLFVRNHYQPFFSFLNSFNKFSFSVLQLNIAKPPNIFSELCFHNYKPCIAWNWFIAKIFQYHKNICFEAVQNGDNPDIELQALTEGVFFCNIGQKYVVSERKESAGKKHSKLEI